jgi:hypothetical protein
LESPYTKVSTILKYISRSAVMDWIDLTQDMVIIVMNFGVP